ncbi:MAG TPA: helix-turn-helix domain-containing protein [Micromonosporaceae bacterium]
MTSLTELIDRLGELGMSGYEAKAYLALVTAGQPLNGYEVAKRSGVPRSTVYETLGKLVARGAAFEARTKENGTSYLPLPPNSLLSRMSRDFESSLEVLRSELPLLAAPQQAHLIHNVSTREALLERSVDVIRETRREMFISVWPDEIADLHPVLMDADERGVDVTMLVFGEDAPVVGHAYRHRYSPPDFVLNYLGYRLFVVVGDNRQAVIGGFENGSGWGVYTDNPAVVLLAVEYVRHDIAMQILGGHFGADQVTDYVRSNPEFISLRAARIDAARLAGDGAEPRAPRPPNKRRVRR